MNERLITDLKAAVGPQGYLEGEDIGPAYRRDIGGREEGQPLLVVRPRNTAEVSKVLALCHAARQPIVPQGGMTGLVESTPPEDGEIVLSLQRMTDIEEVDPATATMTVQSGVPLQRVQEEAAAAGFLFPLDIGARGSCTIGGNLSTNAGGNRVIRYGVARDLVLGVEAVLADGTVHGTLHKMRKNNSGFDLKHLFIGSEGTLGVITRAVLTLRPQPKSQLVAFCAIPDFPTGVRLLRFLDAELGGRLSAFEAMWDNAYRLILDMVKTVRAPIPPGSPFHALVEALGPDPTSDEALFEQVLERAMEQGLITNAAIGKSAREVRDIWAVRDAISEVAIAMKPMLSYDVSMPIGAMQIFAERLIAETGERWPEAKLAVFGHVGDGNLHVVTNVGYEGTPREVFDGIIYSGTRAVQGSVSAEHGIGREKRDWLSFSRTPAEIDLMRRVKGMLDPHNILSPGRVLAAR